MKKIIISISLFFLLVASAFAKPMNIGFTVGLALPNDNVSQFFHQVKEPVTVDTTTVTGRFLLDKATSIGYTLGVKGRIGLAKRFDLVGGIGMTRFNKGRYDLVVPAELGIEELPVAQIQSTANIVPISVGMNTYLFRSFLGLYLSGDVSYNYLSYSYDVIWNDRPIPAKSSESDSRIGYGLGFGLDFDLRLFRINFEAKFNSANIIGRSGDEKHKNYGTITLGIVF